MTILKIKPDKQSKQALHKASKVYPQGCAEPDLHQMDYKLKELFFNNY